MMLETLMQSPQEERKSGRLVARLVGTRQALPDPRILFRKTL